MTAYSFNKHVMSPYCASGPVTGVGDTRKNTAQVQNSESSTGKVVVNTNQHRA